MTISSQVRRHNYIAAGGQTVFPFTFEILAKTDLLVYKGGVLESIITHYTVSEAPWTAGGNVTFNVAPGADVEVVILSGLPLTQVTQFLEGKKFPAASVEDAMDKLTLLIQDLKEAVGRALKLEITSLKSGLSVPDPVAANALMWKDDLSGLKNFVPTPASGVIEGNYDFGAAPPDPLLVPNQFIRFSTASEVGGSMGWKVIDGEVYEWGFISANPV